MKTVEEIQAAATKAWMAYENDMGDDFLAFTDAFVAAFEPLLEAERAKNAALVAALEEIGSFATDEDGEEMDAFDMGQIIGEMVDDAIAANKKALAANEKGGANG